MHVCLPSSAMRGCVCSAVRSASRAPLSGCGLFRRKFTASSFCRSLPPAAAGHAPPPIPAWSPMRFICQKGLVVQFIKL